MAISKPQPWTADTLVPHYDEQDDLWLSNGYTLRKLIGLLGMLLPVLLLATVFIVSGRLEPLHSISHYYYTRAGSVFTIVVSLLAIFLIIYKGVERVDFYISLVAGFAAFCVLLFPTGNLAQACTSAGNCPLPNSCIAFAGDGYSMSYVEGNNFRERFHFGAAGVFLLCLAYMSLFLFTRSGKPVEQRGPKKKMRNLIFRTCGIIIVASIAAIAVLGGLGLMDAATYDRYHLTFWFEVIAVEAFGLSWLVKGEALFFMDDQPAMASSSQA